MQHAVNRSHRGRSVTTAAALAAIVTTAGLAAATAPASAKGGGAPSLTPQVISFPSRDFVSVAEPGGTTPTTTWTHPGAAVQTSTSMVPGLATELGLNDINHVGEPCWSSSLTPPATNMSAGDTVTVAVPGGPADQQLRMTVANVRTTQATAVGTTVTVTGSASDPVTGGQVAAGNLQVRLVAKKQAFTFNGRRDLRAVLGGGKDGVLNYIGTSTNFVATFNLASAPSDVALAVGAQTRGIVQNDPLNPTTITIYETPQRGDGVVHGNAAGCPLP